MDTKEIHVNVAKKNYFAEKKEDGEIHISIVP